jgi:hypothetical protein
MADEHVAAEEHISARRVVYSGIRQSWTEALFLTIPDKYNGHYFAITTFVPNQKITTITCIYAAFRPLLRNNAKQYKRVRFPCKRRAPKRAPKLFVFAGTC